MSSDFLEHLDDDENGSTVMFSMKANGDAFLNVDGDIGYYHLSPNKQGWEQASKIAMALQQWVQYTQSLSNEHHQSLQKLIDEDIRLCSPIDKYIELRDYLLNDKQKSLLALVFFKTKVNIDVEEHSVKYIDQSWNDEILTSLFLNGLLEYGTKEPRSGSIICSAVGIKVSNWLHGNCPVFYKWIKTYADVEQIDDKNKIEAISFKRRDLI